MNDKIIKQAKVVFIIGASLVAIAPFLFTRSFGFLDFSNTGAIGDTIGGITAPIANLLGSLLIFYALQAQIEANRIVQEQIQEQKEQESRGKSLQYLLDQFKILREDINDFSTTTYTSNLEDAKKTTIYLTKKGGDAFRQVIVGMKQYKTKQHLDIFSLNPKLSEVKSILLIMEGLVNQILISPLPDDDKVFLKNLISYQFNSKICQAFDGLEKHKASLQEPCLLCGKAHQGVPDVLFEIVDSISGKLI